MTFNLWLRTLLCYAGAQKKTHLVVRLGSRRLKHLYVQGVAPSLESIAADRKRKIRLQNRLSKRQS